MDIRAIVGAMLLVGGSATGCAHSPPPPPREAFNCTRISELGELELTTQCGDLRRGEFQMADSRSAVVEPSARAERVRPALDVNEMHESRARVIAPRPEVFRPRPMRSPPPPKH